jgi:hypothetical protein
MIENPIFPKGQATVHILHPMHLIFETFTTPVAWFLLIARVGQTSTQNGFSH